MQINRTKYIIKVKGLQDTVECIGRERLLEILDSIMPCEVHITYETE